MKPLRKPKPFYYWITGQSVDGKPFLHGPFVTESKVRFAQGDTVGATIWKLHTRDHTVATHQIRSLEMQASGRSHAALQRVSHGYENVSPEEALAMGEGRPRPTPQVAVGEPDGGNLPPPPPGLPAPLRV